MQQNQVRSIVYTLQQNIRRVIVGKDEAIELALIALLCKGHVLIEDVPGVGKTTLVAALARSLSAKKWMARSAARSPASLRISASLS